MASKSGLTQHLQDGSTNSGNYRTACGCVVTKQSIQESVSDVDCFYCKQEWERTAEERFQRMKEVRIQEVQAELKAARTNIPETNSFGLSFERWKTAAGVSEETLRKAWRNDEDPADWR